MHRLGQHAAGSPVAYLQAGLHADEWPGLLVLQHLLPMLQAAEARGEIPGQVIVVPFANPVGMAQNVFGYVTGRFDLTGRGNFNRNFPTFDLAGFRIDGPEDALPQAFRAFLAESLRAKSPDNETDYLKHQLLGLALEAHFVFDLHCDDHNAAHAYCADFQTELAAAVTRRLGFRHLFTEPLAGVVAFDGSLLKPWDDLTRMLGSESLGDARPLAMTLEYRGQHEVDDELARDDALRLFAVLVDSKVILQKTPSAEHADILAELPNGELRVSPLQAVDTVYAPETGLLVFSKPLGAELKVGEHYADIIRLDQDPPDNRLAMHARTDGVLMGLSHRRLVRPGDQIAKVAGTTPLAHRPPGSLLQL